MAEGNLGNTEILRDNPEDLLQITDTMIPLLRKLMPEIKKDKYCIIVSDETSGRIPTLIVREVINASLRSRDKRPIDALFMIGDRSPRK